MSTTISSVVNRIPVSDSHAAEDAAAKSAFFGSGGCPQEDVSSPETSPQELTEAKQGAFAYQVQFGPDGSIASLVELPTAEPQEQASDLPTQPQESVAGDEAKRRSIGVALVAKALEITEAIRKNTPAPLESLPIVAAYRVTFLPDGKVAADDLGPEPSEAARLRMLERKQQRRNQSRRIVAKHHYLLPLQMGLVRCLAKAGDVAGAKQQLMATIESYARALHAEHTGGDTDKRLVATVLSDLHRRGGLDDAELLSLLGVWHALEVADDPTKDENQRMAIAQAANALTQMADCRTGQQTVGNKKNHRTERAIIAFRRSPEICRCCNHFADEVEVLS